MNQNEVSQIPGIDKVYWRSYRAQELRGSGKRIHVIGMPSAGKRSGIDYWMQRNPDRASFVDQQTKTFQEYDISEEDIWLYQFTVGIKTLQAITAAENSHLPIIVKRGGIDRDVYMDTFRLDDRLDFKLRVAELMIENIMPSQAWAVILCLITPQESLTRRAEKPRPGPAGPTYNHLGDLYSQYLSLHQKLSSIDTELPVYIPINMMGKRERYIRKLSWALNRTFSLIENKF